MGRPVRALVYGDVDLNILDGSAIWLQSMSEVLGGMGVDTTVLLKAPVVTDRLVAAIAAQPGVTVVDPFERGFASGAKGMARPKAVETMLALDAEGEPFDVVITRGRLLVKEILDRDAFTGRLWVYLTDIPQEPGAWAPELIDFFKQIADKAAVVLCQTEELRTFLELSVPSMSGKGLIWLPVVPDPIEAAPSDRADLGTPSRPLRIAYSGKMAPLWRTLEMTAIPQDLAAQGVSVELHMVGDKIHRDASHPEFHDAMEHALHNSPGVIAHGGVPRQKAIDICSAMDIGLSWRAPEMDASLEVSTKLLEFSSMGIPVIVNRNSMHERFLGADYPFFANTYEDVLDLLKATVADPSMLVTAADRVKAFAAPSFMSAARERMAGHMRRVLPGLFDERAEGRTSTRKVLVASHDLKFFTAIEAALDAMPWIEVRRDEWSALAVHDEDVSREGLAWADTIICEWAGPNAVWYSQNKRDDQTLIVRLHRFELSAGWIKDINIDRVDVVICVSEHYAMLTREATGWPADKIRVIANSVDIEQFARPKIPQARFTLGMIGIAPSRKRLDLGLEILSEVRRIDPRFTMAVKSKMPWDYWWVWKNQDERAHYHQVFENMARDPFLQDAVSFDGFGPDVAAWLQRVGFVLSTSDDESFHLAPAEGMASGALPVLLPWPGVETIYERQWIRSDVRDAAAWILDHSSEKAWLDSAAEAFEEVERVMSMRMVCDQWIDLVG